jgi:hypothetical protein
MPTAQLQPVGLQGAVRLILRDEHGRIKDQRFLKNVFLVGGYNLVAERVGNPDAGAAFTAANHIVIGTGTTAPTSTDTALAGFVFSRSGAYSHQSGYQTWTIDTTFAAGEGTAAITESGVQCNSGGTATYMIARQTFAVINKGASDTLQVTWYFKVS